MITKEQGKPLAGLPPALACYPPTHFIVQSTVVLISREQARGDWDSGYSTLSPVPLLQQCGRNSREPQQLGRGSKQSGENQNKVIEETALFPLFPPCLNGRQSAFPISLLLASSHLPSNVQMNRLGSVYWEQKRTSLPA